jgi:hypothetical protein
VFQDLCRCLWQRLQATPTWGFVNKIASALNSVDRQKAKRLSIGISRVVPQEPIAPAI